MNLLIIRAFAFILLGTTHWLFSAKALDGTEQTTPDTANGKTVAQSRNVYPPSNPGQPKPDRVNPATNNSTEKLPKQSSTKSNPPANNNMKRPPSSPGNNPPAKLAGEQQAIPRDDKPH